MGMPRLTPVAALGASLYEVLTSLRKDSKVFTKLDISYSASNPVTTPVVISLPKNGIRLRFDGPDQRLRLIEIVDFHLMRFTYRNEDIVPSQDIQTVTREASPLLYRRVYQLFGPSYPGEFVPPQDGSGTGTYILSFPGIALSFPLQVSAWSPKVDHATMLSSSASPATAVSIFEGNSWPEARKELFVKKPAHPRSIALLTRPKDAVPDEIEHALVHGAGRVELVRRCSPPFFIILSETTPQDLITELGPPNSVYKRSEQDLDEPQKPVRNGARRGSNLAARGSYGSTPSSMSSTNTDTFETDFDDDDVDGDDVTHIEEQYYCYFDHGFDILVGPPTDISPLPASVPTPDCDADTPRPASSADSRLTATRVIFHGNIPGSYPFNRHRRSRWSLEHIPDSGQGLITSESKFDQFHSRLLQAFKGVWPEKDMEEGMVIVRRWGEDSPSGSAILITGEMEETEEGWDKNGEHWLGNTRLYKMPGLMFEVMHNGAVSSLTVY